MKKREHTDDLTTEINMLISTKLTHQCTLITTLTFLTNFSLQTFSILVHISIK